MIEWFIKATVHQIINYIFYNFFSCSTRNLKNIFWNTGYTGSFRKKQRMSYFLTYLLYFQYLSIYLISLNRREIRYSFNGIDLIRRKLQKIIKNRLTKWFYQRKLKDFPFFFIDLSHTECLWWMSKYKVCTLCIEFLFYNFVVFEWNTSLLSNLFPASNNT